jgi:hypothetical protein
MQKISSSEKVDVMNHYIHEGLLPHLWTAYPETRRPSGSGGMKWESL